MNKIRLLIAEDHRVMAEALAQMLSFGERYEVIGMAASGDEAFEVWKRDSPDIVLMDVALEGINGIEATRKIRDADPNAKVLILSMHDDEATVSGAVAAGASGFLPKTIDRTELMEAIEAVSAGEGFLHPSVTRPFLERMAPIAAEAGRKERLTEREQEVLQRLALGESTKEIAEALVLSEETVKTHIAHVYRKLGVSDRVKAVTLALRSGLVR